MKVAYVTALMALATQVLAALRGFQKGDLTSEQIKLVKDLNKVSQQVLDDANVLDKHLDKSESFLMMSSNRGLGAKAKNKKTGKSKAPTAQPTSSSATSAKDLSLTSKYNNDLANPGEGTCAYFSVNQMQIIKEPLVFKTFKKGASYLTWTIGADFKIDLSPGVAPTRPDGGTRVIPGYKIPKNAEWRLSANEGIASKSLGNGDYIPVPTAQVALYYKQPNDRPWYIFVANVPEPKITMLDSLAVKINKVRNCFAYTGSSGPAYRQLDAGNSTNSNSTTTEELPDLTKEQRMQVSKLQPGEMLVFDPIDHKKPGEIVKFDNLGKRSSLRNG